MARKLIGYLPDILRDVREYRVETEAEQPEIERLWGSVDDGFSDQYLPSATENGVAWWERMLGIVPKATETLDERKFVLLARLNERLPYTVRQLRQQLANLCGEDGFTLEVRHESYQVKVLLELKSKNMLAEASRFLRRVCPANLVLDVSIRYNQHETVARYTHAQLAAWTHGQIRNEVLT